MIRNPVRLLVLTVAVLATLGVVSPASAATSPYCGITWGSLDKDSATGSGGYVDDVRAGQHTCYDRLVVDVQGSRSYGTWHAGYVDQVSADPSGLPVSLRGGAFLQLALRAPTATPHGTLTYVPARPRARPPRGWRRTGGRARLRDLPRCRSARPLRRLPPHRGGRAGPAA